MADQTEQSNTALPAKQTEAWVETTQQHAKANKRHPVKLKKVQNEAGETRVEQPFPEEEFRCRRYETTGFSDPDGAVRLLAQVLQAQTRFDPNDEGQLNSTAAILNGIAPTNPLEGLLAAQMTAAHNMAMEFSHRAMLPNQTEEGVERNINRATKMMRSFVAQTEALQKLRNQGQQKIVVQHVQVNEGGQAVIGDIHAKEAKP